MEGPSVAMSKKVAPMMVVLSLLLNQTAHEKVSQMEHSKMLELGLELGVETALLSAGNLVSGRVDGAFVGDVVGKSDDRREGESDGMLENVRVGTIVGS